MHRGARSAALALLLGIGLGAAPGAARAQGPDSGEEVTSSGPSPQMLQRIYKESAARKAKQARIAELRNKINVLRGALPGILTEGLRESDLYNTEFRDFHTKNQTFLPRWTALWKVLAMAPPARISSVYESFGIREVWSADTTDWSQAKRRTGEADGDDFYLYCEIVFPQPLVTQELYTIDWTLRGFDHEGKERVVHAYWVSYSSPEYIRPKGQYVTYRRRVTGLGLSPGWYEAEATLKIKGKYYLQRRFYGAVKISRVNPMLAAPPVYHYRYKDEAKIKLTAVSFDSRGVKRGEINPADVKVSGKFQVDAEMAGADKSLVAGADVYPAGSDGKIPYGGRPIRAAFRFRQDLKRPTGSFGSETESRVKQLDGGLNPGKYVLRVWVAASKGTSVYWAFEDKPFEVQAAKPLPRTPGGR
jgi:hypothetical protein